MLGQGVAITDEIMGVSRLLGARVFAAPQVYACGFGALTKMGEHHSHATLCV